VNRSAEYYNSVLNHQSATPDPEVQAHSFSAAGDTTCVKMPLHWLKYVLLLRR